MLVSLTISNIAVIDKMSVDFQSGFTVLTGETGAGKSILIDALGLALGAKASKELIRSGEQEAGVSAFFVLADGQALKQVEALGISCPDGEILLSRTLLANGRSIAKINGALVNTALLRECSALLLNIHGQHENNALLDVSRHIQYLDSFAGISKDLSSYLEQYLAFQALGQELSALQMDDAEKFQRMDFLSFQLEELKKSRLAVGEEEKLQELRRKLSNGEKIMAGFSSAYRLLYQGEMQKSAYDLLFEAQKALESISSYDEGAQSLGERVAELTAVTADCAQELRAQIDGFAFSPDELEAVEERLNTIYQLKRKYNKTVEELIAYAQEIEETLQSLQNHDAKIHQLTIAYEAQEKALKAAALALTKKRIAAAKKLEQAVKQELCDLDMAKMEFSVCIKQEDMLHKNGADRVEFLIAPNPGEGLKPLSKIASGGEMARIMLALKSVLSKNDSIETLIFDEIDTGVSGRAAQKISEKLYALSKDKQVLSVTHLPQIAAMGDYHLLIEKTVRQSKTTTTVYPLTGEERVRELARITGGVQITDLTLENARQMLSLAQSGKQK